MSSTIEILKNANRLVLDQLDAADERIKAKETEARQTLDNCVSKRESIKRKRQLIQDIERVQLDSIAEIEEVEALVGELPDRLASERPTLERPVLERPLLERPALERSALERATLERGTLERPAQESTAPARIADRLAFAVVKASQSNLQMKR
jgi:hypothetical protein